MRNSAALILFVLLCACSGKKESSDERIKLQQYLITGKQLYMQHCSMCHQVGGEGLARLYPPLNKSDYMKNHLEEVICLIKYGKTEPIMVNGTTYTQPMPGNGKLTNLEIAEVATYIYNTWEHEHGIIDVKEVDKILSMCEN